MREGILCRLPRRRGKLRKKVPGLKSVRPLVDSCLTVFGGLSLDHGTLGSKRICQAGVLEEDKSFPPAFRDDPIHYLKPNLYPAVFSVQCLLLLSIIILKK